MNHYFTNFPKSDLKLISKSQIASNWLIRIILFGFLAVGSFSLLWLSYRSIYAFLVNSHTTQWRKLTSNQKCTSKYNSFAFFHFRPETDRRLQFSRTSAWYFWQYNLTALGFVTVKSLQVQIHTWKAPEVWPIDWG